MDSKSKKGDKKDSFLDLSSARNQPNKGGKKDDSLDFLNSGRKSKKSNSLDFEDGANASDGLGSFLDSSPRQKPNPKPIKRKASDSLDFGDGGAADSFLQESVKNNKAKPARK